MWRRTERSKNHLFKVFKYDSKENLKRYLRR